MSIDHAKSPKMYADRSDECGYAPIYQQSKHSHSSEQLLERNCPDSGRSLVRTLLLYGSLFLNVILLLGLVAILGSTRMSQDDCSADPSIAIYSPANTAVEWIAAQQFRAALFNNTAYMGVPDETTDKLWSDLYNFGISTISKQEAALLPVPTLPIRGTQDYLIELDIWHELHCLNDLRKILYPEYYVNATLDNLRRADGTIERNNDMFRHWDHCIDSLRQSLMCHADVAPISFHVNVPARTGIFPRLATTHTCRNFTKIQEWAKEHEAPTFKYTFDSAEEAEEVIASAGFSQDPGEDVQFLYKSFPGDQYFKYWREHDVLNV